MKREMSYFHAPIAPQRDADGNILQAATLTPVMNVSVEHIHQLITTNETLRQLTATLRTTSNLRSAKAALLPYVLPCGVFTRRKSDSLIRLSGLFPIDVDGLASWEEASRMRIRLFTDRYLQPALCFISPSGRGVKAFVPYPLPLEGTTDVAAYVTDYIRNAMDYVRAVYGMKWVDVTGKDLARACFLCHDAGALVRSEFL